MSQLTVIIPALNAMPYLPEALASLQAQTFQDFEVIFWDNGSTDGTADEARRWIPSILPGRVVTNEPLPLHYCLQRMVEEAGTTYIARMDADDVSKPYRFALQLQALANDPELAVVGCQFDQIDSTGAPLPKSAGFPVSYAGILSAFITCNAILHPSVMMRRQPILDSGNYKQCPPPCEDYDLWMRVAKKYRIANLHNNLLVYRVHQGGIISSARAKGQLEEPNRRCIQRHCADLFCISPALYYRLRTQRLIPSCFVLLWMALCIARRSNTSITSILGSESFLFSARCLTSKHDLLSRALWYSAQRLFRDR